MMENWNGFITNLTQVELLKLARDDAISDWGEDIKITVLFASIGRKIAEEFDEYLPDELVYIFNIIESAMSASDIGLKTLVATGLLEALYSKAASDAILWKRIENQLGEASRKYLIEWGSWSE